MNNIKQLGIVCVLVIASFAFAETVCKIIVMEGCVTVGRPCEVDGVNGTISYAQKHNHCKDGSPGSTICKTNATADLCNYTCHTYEIIGTISNALDDVRVVTMRRQCYIPSNAPDCE